MGNARSAPDPETDPWWNPPDPNPRQRSSSADHTQTMEAFKQELALKHERRRQLIAEKHQELQRLRDEVQLLRKENEELKNTRVEEVPAFEDIRRRNLDLKMAVAGLQKELQELNAEVAGFEKERHDYKAHVVALKDVVSVSKQMLLIREAQLKELREKVREIEASLNGKELTVLSQDLKEEYERQLQNIKNLRVFYEERQRADRKEKDEMKRLLDELKKELAKEKDRNAELTENLDRLEEENSKKYDEIKSLESNLGLTKAEGRQYQAELSVINQLFAQILLGFNNNQEVDIDKLIKLLEENHHLLQDIAVNEESNQVSALPKVLLDLINEVNQHDEQAHHDEEGSHRENSHQMNSVPEIVENLPKVWKVLIELLSHQSAPVVYNHDTENPCYKVVETPKGPHLALSVSKTFIRLKDLILEKKTLERETGRLKHLNTHLEGRLQDQEKRLELVTRELSETWNVVGKLQKKHQLLHTQEKILRYELAQKRKLLTELKEELEYSREKWQEAREKNSDSQKQWEQLRLEFASRKNTTGDDYNNSVESGYSDDKECSSEDEPSYEIDVSESKKAEQKHIEEVTSDQKTIDQDNSEQNTIDEGNNEQKTVEELDSEEKKGADIQPSVETVISEQNTVEEVTGEQKYINDDSEQKTVAPLAQTEVGADVTEQETPRDGEQKTVEEVLSSREQRLLRLESMCQGLVKQVTNTTNRSEAISTKLDVLHEMYGEGSGESSTDPK